VSVTNPESPYKTISNNPNIYPNLLEDIPLLLGKTYKKYLQLYFYVTRDCPKKTHKAINVFILIYSQFCIYIIADNSVRHFDNGKFRPW